ncbi:MAG TPA: Ig-like domain-containing protein [Polyangiaceae bacterium]|jgi:alpha-tubulin suppressor-like RCC1 family protein|nr:Ig-like domain-containing protein [Polyangiaceae bacterium]
MKSLKLFALLAIALAYATPSQAACTGTCSISASAVLHGGNTSYAATASADATKVDYYVDGVLMSTSFGSPWNTSVGFPTVAPGAHTFKAIGTFSGGTVETAPQSIFVGDTEICQGGDFGCAIASGGVVCWGEGSAGQLGNGGTLDSLVPVPVTNASGGATSVVCGAYHACAIVNGAAVCWGHNSDGQIGDGTLTSRTVGQSVSGLTSGVVQLSSGDFTTCATLSTGAVKCWGDNYFGQIGDGTTTSRTAPVAVSGISGATMVATGRADSCAIVSGALKCWGDGSYGGLGNGANTSSLTAVAVSGMSSGVTWATVGIGWSCAVQSGAAKCWGYNPGGELGNGTIDTSGMNDHDSNVPVSVSGLSSGVQNMSASEFTTCAVTSSGAASCWGLGDDGELGDGFDYSNSPTSPHLSTTPVAVSGHGSGTLFVAAPAALPGATCDLNNAHFYCWGDNSQKQLGNGGTPAKSLAPARVSGL